MNIDFIGLGAQKSGTSWVYACLCDHPEVCAPVKELHFFSRERFEKGRDWYESHFQKCGEKVRGEFSTSYLYSKETPERIQELYPEVKLVAILRNPVDRAISQYRNALKGGHIKNGLSFESYMAQDASVIGQGLYHEQLQQYLEHFTREQILILIYEDIKKDPQAFISAIYKHIGVDHTFVPAMLNAEVNVARTPKLIFIERIMHHVSEFLRKSGFSNVVHTIRKSGLPDLIRAQNTKDEKPLVISKSKLSPFFLDDAQKLSALLGRNLVQEWKL